VQGGRTLVERFPAIRALVKAADAQLVSQGFAALSPYLFPECGEQGVTAEEEACLHSRLSEDASICQPAILLQDYIWYFFLTSICGLQPDLVAGHSLGELMALCAAGLLPGRDAAHGG
jgi:malonyl CoA-acyl carrier protein transacylase